MDVGSFVGRSAGALKKGGPLPPGHWPLATATGHCNRLLTFDFGTASRVEVVAGGFQCPETPEIAQGAFSRHPHNDDCRLYYTCQQGVAREYGCPEGTVFQIHPEIENQGFCTDPADVPGW